MQSHLEALFSWVDEDRNGIITLSERFSQFEAAEEALKVL